MSIRPSDDHGSRPALRGGGFPAPALRRLLLPRPSALALFAAALLLAGCMQDRASGGGSETTVVGVTGKVVDAAGTPVPGAAVRVRPEGALPRLEPGAGANPGGIDEAPMAFTEADGSFLITDLAPGEYYVECRGQYSGAALVAAKVEDSVVRLPDAVLQPPGAVRGRIMPPPSAFQGDVDAYVYIPGLPARTLALVRDSMRFVLADVPAGRYTLRVQPAFPRPLGVYGVLEVRGVEIPPGDTLDLDTLILPLRAAIQDSAYSRDSSALLAILRANAAPGFEDTVVEYNSMVTGNRIIALYNFEGSIRRLTPEIGTLDRLEVLYLWGPGQDSLVSLEVSPEIRKLRGLKRLWLRSYALDGLPSWAESFRELSSLMLSASGLKAFPPRVADFAFLSYLDLSGNAIPALPPAIGRMKQLRVLDLSDNDLSSLPAELMAMQSLKGVRLRKNRLCSVEPAWKAWITLQDSLWIKQVDPFSYYNPKDSGWEATQKCAGIP